MFGLVGQRKTLRRRDKEQLGRFSFARASLKGPKPCRNLHLLPKALQKPSPAAKAWQKPSPAAIAWQKPSPAAKALQEPSPGLSRTCGSDCFSLTSANEQAMGRRLFLFFSF